MNELLTYIPVLILGVVLFGVVLPIFNALIHQRINDRKGPVRSIHRA